MGKVNSVICIPVGERHDFFRYWFMFLRPFHHLTDREIEVAAAFVRYHYELGQDVLRKDLLAKIVMNEDTKRKIREECGMSTTYFQSIMTKLKKSKVIIGDRLNPKFIPKMPKGSKTFNLLLSFDIKDNE